MALKRNYKNVGKMLTTVKTLKAVRRPFKNKSISSGIIFNKEWIAKAKLYNWF